MTVTQQQSGSTFYRLTDSLLLTDVQLLLPSKWIFIICGVMEQTAVHSDLLCLVMMLDSSLTESSSSMWTRVALRVTTPFPLQTLLGSTSESIQEKSGRKHIEHTHT